MGVFVQTGGFWEEEKPPVMQPDQGRRTDPVFKWGVSVAAPRNKRDVAAGDTDVIQFTVGHLIEIVAGVAILTPILE